jgi:hypothetical protein
MAPSGFRPCCYTETATDLGFTTLAVNDHLVFLVPWLRWANGAGCRPGSNRRHDAGHYRLAASGPRPRPADQVADYADLLSPAGWHVALGPGSSQQGYEAAGVAFHERWGRLVESVTMLRILWRMNEEPFTGNYCSTDGIVLRPMPALPGGPLSWIGSWDPAAGLRRATGRRWLTSAYNTTPRLFRRVWAPRTRIRSARSRNCDVPERTAS